MRKFLWILLAVGASGCRSPGSTPIPEARADEPSRAGGGVAVVELFTSEGCSSCPPADGVLADVSRQGRESGLPVFAVAFHVDYWDSLGWPDPFASPDNTARQRAYGRALGARGLYTPQMIVDGSDAFIGSDRDRAQGSVASALGRPARRPSRCAPGSMAPVRSPWTTTSRARPPGPGSPSWWSIALLSVAVRAGENAGRTLHHTDTARALTTVGARASFGEADA